jgi:predicted signal transduction protein with EAL and GGDEF domain
MPDELQDPPDQLALALRAVAFGILLGVAVIAAALWAVRTVQLVAPPTTPLTPAKGIATLLIGGTLAGVLAAGVGAWSLMAPVTSFYRRGGLSFVTSFATVACSLVCIPVDGLFGRTGLLVLVLIAGLGCVWLGRMASRAAVEA